MGLGAFVRCNCYRDGLTTEPPFPREELLLDTDGYLCLITAENAENELPYKEWQEKYGEAWWKLQHWKDRCCEHDHMKYAHEDVGNWYGVRHFTGIIESLGAEHFPLLSNIIPDGNDGSFPREDAEAAIRELDLLVEMSGQTEEVCLVDVDSGEEVYGYISAWGGVFMFAWNHQVGLDPNGVFVVDPRNGQELFRSSHLKQTLLAEKVNGDTPALLTCLDTGATCEVFSAIGNEEKDRELRIEKQPVDTENLYAERALRKLLLASIETGNPIIWC